MQPRPLELLLSTFALYFTAGVSAFSDTSPFFLVSSTSSIPSAARSHNIVSTESFVSTATKFIKRCDSDAYIIVSQPGIHIEDFTAQAHTAIHMKDLLGSVETAGRWVAENVYPTAHTSNIDAIAGLLQEVARSACGAQVEDVDIMTGTFKMFDESEPKVVRVDFGALPPQGKARAKKIEQNDALLHSVLEMVRNRKFTLVYASSSTSVEKESNIGAVVDAEASVYSALELRSLDYREDSPNNETKAVGGLFHRYQFFTPALFMGYLALFFMLAILYVGLSAISSITVSYGSFDKEMGPAAAKKQQ